MKKTSNLAASELIINPDGSIYHLALCPEDIASTVILVGDPARVNSVSKYFDRIEIKKQKREFITHTGYVGEKRISVISTGIGTDNIDIVLNEIDALVNIDFDKKEIKTQKTTLNFIRIGTSGALQADIPVDNFLASAWGFGLDGLLHFYTHEILPQVQEMLHSLENPIAKAAYAFPADNMLLEHFGKDFYQGITLTCSGFYAPQGRQLRLQAKWQNMLDYFQQQQTSLGRFTNFEMETSSIYGLSHLLGHRALSLNLILANRAQGTFSPDPYKAMDKLIATTLEKFSNL
ncbi:MAG: nucleoside phosphorylase [Chitinophagales bacterium]|nr:nucleoside phosphorylase [Bacteroidota bacterium]MCB9044102.1 nucleoside phosphorylase [Chitinophagales bacterium]